MLKNMTHEQLNIFYYVRDWCLQKRTNQDIDCLRLFITGGAGTGKSHLLKCIYYETTKILNEMNNDKNNEIRTLICAPTNAAALNMNCTTIHSTFKIGIKNFSLSENILNTMRSKLDSLCLLFIDEISLVDQSLWRELHTRLSQITHKTGSNIYFGNVSIVAVEDFYQLPPVKGIPLYLSNNVIDYWQNLFEYCELTICQRTKQADFYALANRIRKKTKKETFSEKDREMLQRCVDRYNSKMYQDDCLHLFAWNKFVDEHNENMLSLKCKNILDIPAKKLNTSQKQLVRKRNKKINTFDYKNLRIAVNARVVIEENANRDDGIVKGAFGNVVEIVFDSIKKDFVDHIRIKFDNDDCGRQHQNICEICRKEKTVCIQRYNNPWDEDGQRKNTEQFPIRLGWTSTVHKVQGLTVESVVIDLKRFNQTGQGYVGFTRPPLGDGVFLSNLKDDAFFCDERIEESVNNMRKMLYQYAPVREKSLFRIGFHNVEGLETHYDDIKNHNWYNTCNLICINETWLQSTHCQSELKDFNLLIQNRSNSYHNKSLSERDRGGVGILVRNDTNFEMLDLPCCDVESLTIKSQILNELCFVTTVYKPPNMKSKVFINNFHQLILLLNLENHQHIIMGDFNENINSTNNPIHKYFEDQGYKQLIYQNTTIENTSLDCIFVKNVITKQEISIIPSYFSYHHALILDLFESNIDPTEIIPTNNNKKKTDNHIPCSSDSKYSSKKKKTINESCQIKRKTTTNRSVQNTVNKKQKKASDEIISKKINQTQNHTTFTERIHSEHLNYSSTLNTNLYSFEDIQNLLKKHFENREDTLMANKRFVTIFSPILGNSIIHNESEKEHNEVFDQIHAFQRQCSIDESYAIINEIIIPINLNGKHWVLLFIDFPTPNNNNYSVFYFDSLGEQIPLSIVDALIQSKIIRDRSEIHSNFQQILQFDEYNCGPWVITSTIQWLDTKKINIEYLSIIDIEQERIDQQADLHQINSHLLKN
jgi:hypothetical protein